MMYNLFVRDWRGTWSRWDFDTENDMLAFRARAKHNRSVAQIVYGKLNRDGQWVTRFPAWDGQGPFFPYKGE
jgi:hypothetical protein